MRGSLSHSRTARPFAVIPGSVHPHDRTPSAISSGVTDSDRVCTSCGRCLRLLLVVLARRAAASYSLYAAATLVLGLSAHNLDSFERYA